MEGYVEIDRMVVPMIAEMTVPVRRKLIVLVEEPSMLGRSACSLLYPKPRNQLVKHRHRHSCCSSHFEIQSAMKMAAQMKTMHSLRILWRLWLSLWCR